MKNVVTHSHKEVLPVITREALWTSKAMNRNGLSIRRIAKITRSSSQDGETPLGKYIIAREYHKTKRRASILDPYRPLIDAYLEEDSYQASWIFDKLMSMGYTGGYTIVKDAVRAIKGEETRIAYIGSRRNLPSEARSTGETSRSRSRMEPPVPSMPLSWTSGIHGPCMSNSWRSGPSKPSWTVTSTPSRISAASRKKSSTTA